MMEKDKSSAPPVTTDSYIIKMKAAGHPDERIASKLMIPVEEVRRRLYNLEKAAQVAALNGSQEFVQMAQLAATQFQLMGTTLGLLIAGINNSANPEDLRKVLSGNLMEPGEMEYVVIERVIELLTKHFVILNPFVVPDVKKLIEETTKPNQN